MAKGSGGSEMTRGDRRRNARRERLRGLLPRDGAVAGVGVATALGGSLRTAGLSELRGRAFDAVTSLQ